MAETVSDPSRIRRWFMCAILCAGLLFPLAQAQAFQTMYSTTSDGEKFFEFEFASKGEYFNKDPSEASKWTLNSAQKRDVVRAGNLWTEILHKGAKNKDPIYFEVITSNDDDNAFCGTEGTDMNGIDMLAVPRGIIKGVLQDRMGFMTIGILKNSKNGLAYSQLPHNNDFVGTIFHEFGHALGITSKASFDKTTDGITVFESHLLDRYGTKMQPNIVVTSTNPKTAGSGQFYVGKEARSGVTFHGTHVAEVMGNDDGVPIQGWESKEGKRILDLAHLELEHSLMSHQNYRNYNNFMEAEIALLQDIGYKIDRKNFFGKTIFGDNQTVRNTQGFFARNSAGTAYLDGEENTATMGLGLHIYGKSNTVTQAADILAGGEAAVGIRIDGSDNTLKVPSNVNIEANGTNGTALMVAYGKNHEITSQGNLTAEGKGGIAARFDFGHNLVGDHSEYRGSWILTENKKNQNLYTRKKDSDGHLYNLDGPLVKQFDVSGDLIGKKAAIFISENAFVQNINILNGANVEGHIISEWDPEDSLVQYSGDKTDLHTKLTFGYKPTSSGKASTKVADDFEMNLKGSIDGPDSIDMVVAGGQLDVAGTVDVYSLENNGYLAIHGTDDAGISANVTENFVNNSGATLETSVYNDGSVAAIKANRAKVAGTWALRPEAGFYANKKVIKVSSLFKANVSGWFSNVTLAETISKTLTFQMVNYGRNPSFMATRAANAYSQFAKTNGAAELGRSLVGISNKASGDMQKLITALDWSLDGQGIGQALNKLGPEAYDASAKSSLNQQSEFNTLLTNRLLGYVRNAMGSVNRSAAGPNDDTPSGKWIGWGSFFGSTSHQGDHNDMSGYTSQGVGFLGGADHNFDSGLTLGMHVGFSTRRTKMNGDHDAKSYTKSAFIGGQAIYAPESWDGLYVTGQARIGLEDGTMYRRVDIGSYERSNESRWTAPLWSALLGVGKDFCFEAGEGVLAAGPLAWLEYSALYRPEISESYGKATRLKLDATTYQSLQSALGGHVSYESSFANGTTMKANALAGWRHELSEGTMRTSASFRSYGNHSFTSETETPGRDALLLQGSLNLTHKSGFFAEVGLGGETLRTASSSFNGSLTMGLEF